MNVAKQKVIDMLQQIPDNIQNTEDVITRLAVLERLDRSEQDYVQNGGIPSEQVKTHIDEMALKLQ